MAASKEDKFVCTSSVSQTGSQILLVQKLRPLKHTLIIGFFSDDVSDKTSSHVHANLSHNTFTTGYTCTLTPYYTIHHTVFM